MNLNQIQLEQAVQRGLNLLVELKKDYPELRLYPVFSRFWPRSGQCGVTTNHFPILMDFPEMLIISKKTKDLGNLMRSIRRAEELMKSLKNPELMRPEISALQKECNALKKKLPDPIAVEYCGDVNIEFRCGVLKYESLQRLQQDSRLPPGLNTAGNIRVIAGSLEILAEAGD